MISKKVNIDSFNVDLSKCTISEDQLRRIEKDDEECEYDWQYYTNI